MLPVLTFRCVPNSVTRASSRDRHDGKVSNFVSNKKYIGVGSSRVLASALSDDSDRRRKLRCCD
jgi:hypothetical protein